MENFMFFALITVLLGIIFEEKFIALEDKISDYICDRLGWLAAQIVIKYRKLRKMRNEKM